jgi:hypothetical protein
VSPFVSPEYLKIGRFLLTGDECNGQSTHLEKGYLRMSDTISRFVQKLGFALSKPLFYALNYGNNDICDFGFSSADCKRQLVRSGFPIVLQVRLNTT